MAVFFRAVLAALRPTAVSQRERLNCTGMMTEPNLLIISITAFIAVVMLLALLAGVIRLLTVVFPERTAEVPDATLLAAIHAAAALAYPGTRVTSIEETR